ncbi:ferritin-like domain-containing protein [Moorella sulfitireducens (nom. illeg.)]|uniref:ferritin-like domain-containing protein n=1 Tax=Neomoorella sulfitireducens TaxID=2972948 RepID=UPI0021ABF783|nr:ferritin-like domain-containing protein [Moorella sulfitireducens]
MKHYQPGAPLVYNQWQLQIPQLPVLGPNDFGKLLQNIYNSIVAEATAADFYSRLLRETPDQLHREFINHAYQDELEHLEAFTRLYEFFTGQIPQYNIDPVHYRTYKDGLLKALRDELEAADFYKDVILSSTDQMVRDTFFLAMGDELEHATRFGVLYNIMG